MTTKPTTPPITACLLHADFHTMNATCWDATTDWYFEHQEQSPEVQRAGYMAAVERRMLDLVRVGHAIDHALPAPIDRSVRRDHSLCGVQPCSDCR